ncbi:MAG: glycosyltransferase [Eubacterium sp.]|nr:glycosyltransferase [Eubacterium sp.]
MRVKNLLRNSFFGMLGQILLIGFGFICQRVLNMRLGEALVGMNGVISNILAILSVSELGIATAVVYNLYQALADNDEQKIAGLMNLYRKAYYIFASVITLLGLAVLPFVHLFLKSNPFTVTYVRQVYLLWLIRTVLAYLLSYRRSILIADQREYVVSIAALLANALDYTVIILIVEYSGNFLLALGLNIVIDTVSNLWISHYVHRKYPFLHERRKEPLVRELRTRVFANVKNIFASHLADKLLVATDNVILSSFIGVAFVGLYNNYCLITNALTNIARALSNAIQPSVGTMFVKNHKQGDELLRMVTFLFFLFATSASCGIYHIITPFVRDFWLDGSYVLDMGIVSVCVLNFFLLLMSMPVTMVMGVTGLFEKERNIAIASALCNMILSLGLVQVCGIYGLFAGTFVAYLMQMSYRIYVFYRLFLQMSMQRYLKDLMQYLLLAMTELLLLQWLKGFVYQTGDLWRFGMLILVTVGMPFAVNVVLFSKSWRMQCITSLLFAKKDVEKENVSQNEDMQMHNARKIAFFSGDITGNGGTERVGTLIADGLAKEETYEVVMISLTQERAELTFPMSEQIKREVLSSHKVRPGLGYLPLIFKLKKCIEKHGIELIVDIDGVLDVLSLPVKWMTKVSVISWEHFYYFDSRRTWYRKPIRRLAAYFADAIVTLTEEDRGFYEQKLTIRHHIQAIHNPADYLLQSIAVQEERSFEKKNLLSVGGLVPAKGFVQVPRIAYELTQRFPQLDFVWTIAGEGVQRKEIEREIVTYGMQERIRLLGYVENVESLYREALVYVMTSEREGLPMVLLEAKYSGLPIVSFDIRTGPSEVIRDGVNGYLITVTGDEKRDAEHMAEAIGTLLSEESRYRSFAEHVSDDMEAFSMDVILAQWKELITKILQEKSEKRSV